MRVLSLHSSATWTWSFVRSCHETSKHFNHTRIVFRWLGTKSVQTNKFLIRWLALKVFGAGTISVRNKTTRKLNDGSTSDMKHDFGRIRKWSRWTWSSLTWTKASMSEVNRLKKFPWIAPTVRNLNYGGTSLQSRRLSTLASTSSRWTSSAVRRWACRQSRGPSSWRPSGKRSSRTRRRKKSRWRRSTQFCRRRESPTSASFHWKCHCSGSLRYSSVVVAAGLVVAVVDAVAVGVAAVAKSASCCWTRGLKSSTWTRCRRCRRCRRSPEAPKSGTKNSVYIQLIARVE